MNFDFLLCPDYFFYKQTKEWLLCATIGCRYVDDCGDLDTKLNEMYIIWA